jgi:hypothetical protein
MMAAMLENAIRPTAFQASRPGIFCSPKVEIRSNPCPVALDISLFISLVCQRVARCWRKAGIKAEVTPEDSAGRKESDSFIGYKRPSEEG